MVRPFFSSTTVTASEGVGDHLFETIRASCRQVADAARFVTIHDDALPNYAGVLLRQRPIRPLMDPAVHYLDHDLATAAFFLTLSAVNFGSGFFPDILGTIRSSGYRTIAAALTDRFRCQGVLTAPFLAEMQVPECAALFRLDPANLAAAELVRLFTLALNDLGLFLCQEYGGDVISLFEDAAGSAERLVNILAAMPLYRDVASYHGLRVPFYKRAQLLAIDLYIAFGGEGWGRFSDIDRLTICADNLVPHVLRLDGILRYEGELAARIDAGEEVAAGSAEEVEIRAAAVEAAERLVCLMEEQGGDVNAMLLDNMLWHRGQEASYRARRRHLTRTFCY